MRIFLLKILINYYKFYEVCILCRSKTIFDRLMFTCFHAWVVDNPDQLLVILRIFNCSIKLAHCKYLLSNYLN